MSDHLDVLSNTLEKLFRSEKLTPSEFMNGFDSTSKLCSVDRENDIMNLLFRICFDYIRETEQQYNILVELYDFMKTCPIPTLSRDLNSGVVEILKNDIVIYLEQRRVFYQKTAESVARILSFTGRFYLPLLAKRREEFLYHNEYYPYEKSIDLMLMNIWRNFSDRLPLHL